MPHKADPTVLCQCGAIISKNYMEKHTRMFCATLASTIWKNILEWQVLYGKTY